MKYRLHCFAQSGNAYKAALMLNLCGADWEAVFVDYFNGGHLTPAYRELNELGEVPVLEAGELVLSQSGVILDYLADTFEQFDAHSVPEHREILRWILFDNHKLTSYFATLRFMRQFTDRGEDDVTAFFETRARAALTILDQRVESRAFVLGDRLTIADVSLCAYLYFGEEAGFDLATEFPSIAGWLERIAAQPGWQHPYELMPGHPLESKA